MLLVQAMPVKTGQTTALTSRRFLWLILALPAFVALAARAAPTEMPFFNMFAETRNRTRPQWV